MTVATDLEDLATELVAEISERADEVERARCVPRDLSRAFARAGFYRMFVPTGLGGLEASPVTASRVFETLARADASCAWVAFIGATSGSALARIPEQAARAIFATAETLVCGVFAPTGRAEWADGGFVVSGRWQWGSGSQNADWLLGGCVLHENRAPMADAVGTTRRSMMLFPAHEAEFLDTWYVSGLRGTGSCDYRVEGLFVPDAHVVGDDVVASTPSPLDRFPHFTLLALGIAAVTLGIARAAIEDLVDLARSKKRFGSGVPLAMKSHTQIEVARAHARFLAARSYYYDALAAAWNAALGGEPVSLALRRDMRLATTHAVGECAAVVDSMYHLAGGSSVYEASLLQRRFRDVHVATQHIMVAPGSLETAGRLLLGVDTDVSQF